MDDCLEIACGAEGWSPANAIEYIQREANKSSDDRRRSWKEWGASLQRNIRDKPAYSEIIIYSPSDVAQDEKGDRKSVRDPC